MRDRLKLLAAAFALPLAFALAAPQAAQAQETDRHSDGETVTVDFELSVTGGVPGWQYFHVEHSGEESPLCTTHTGQPGPTCEGGGAYTASAEVPAGEPVDFAFVRDGDPGPSETFASGTRTFTEDTTVEATYGFPADEPPEPIEEPSGGADDQYANDEETNHNANPAESPGNEGDLAESPDDEGEQPAESPDDEGDPAESPGDEGDPAESPGDEGSELPARLPDTGGLPLAAGFGLVAAGLGLALVSRRLR